MKRKNETVIIFNSKLFLFIQQKYDIILILIQKLKILNENPCTYKNRQGNSALNKETMYIERIPAPTMNSHSTVADMNMIVLASRCKVYIAVISNCYSHCIDMYILLKPPILYEIHKQNKIYNKVDEHINLQIYFHDKDTAAFNPIVYIC